MHFLYDDNFYILHSPINHNIQECIDKVLYNILVNVVMISKTAYNISGIVLAVEMYFFYL